MPTLGENLQAGITALGGNPNTQPCEKYLAYLALLQRWNKAYNLSGIREPARMVTHHILDSLAVLPHLHGTRCMDVGTGAGLPGLILALARPDTHWVLLDSNGKKIRFLNQCLRELAMGNAEVVQARVESYQPVELFDTIISRAFSSLTEFYATTKHLLAPKGLLLAMKGPNPEEEVTPELVSVADVEKISLRIPGVEGRRTVVSLRQLQATSDKRQGKQRP